MLTTNSLNSRKTTLLDLVSPETANKLKDIIDPGAAHYRDNQKSSYDLWIDQKMAKLNEVKSGADKDFKEFVDSGKTYGLLTTLIGCNGIYFEKFDGAIINKHTVGWFFNVNVWMFNCVVIRTKEQFKINEDRPYYLNSIPIYKGFKRTPFNKGVLSLIPDVNDFRIINSSVAFSTGQVEFIPTNKVARWRTSGGEFFYFLPVCEAKLIKQEFGLSSFDNWDLIK